MKFYLGSKVPINTPSAFSALIFFNDLEMVEMVRILGNTGWLWMSSQLQLWGLPCIENKCETGNLYSFCDMMAWFWMGGSELINTCYGSSTIIKFHMYPMILYNRHET